MQRYNNYYFSTDFLEKIWWIRGNMYICRQKKHNSITKRINWSKNEENDNGCKQLPSGSLAKLKNLVCESAMVFCALSTKVFLDILLQLFGWCDRVTPQRMTLYILRWVRTCACLLTLAPHTLGAYTLVTIYILEPLLLLWIVIWIDLSTISGTRLILLSGSTWTLWRWTMPSTLIG